MVSASANCRDVLIAAGIADLFEVRIDGVVGVNRAGQAAALKSHGADIVVADLAELLDRP
jgi:beta-phosphoglucomutase-like phosphatase (HAD superfamily)